MMLDKETVYSLKQIAQLILRLREAQTTLLVETECSVSILSNLNSASYSYNSHNYAPLVSCKTHCIRIYRHSTIFKDVNWKLLPSQ